MILRIETLGEHGIVTDLQPWQLPPNALNDGSNVRFNDGKAIRFLGHKEAFDPEDDLGADWDGGLGSQIYHLLPVAEGADYYWIFGGRKVVGVYSNSSGVSKDISNAGFSFTATDNTVDWTSCIIGGIPVLNNGVDVPQMWDLDFSTPGRLTNLTDFENHADKCGALRAYKNYLVALDITKSGTRYPSLVKWSDSSALGSVPASWDETDATTDAGENELAGTRTDVNVGVALDCMTLRDSNIIYRDDSIWSMNFVGGTFVFEFRKIYSAQGMLARRCMAEFEGKHFVVGQSDVFVHDGANFNSVIDTRRKDALYADIDPDYFDKTYVFANYPISEMWICYVSRSSGNTRPNKAYVWNWRHKTWGIRDLPSNTAHIEGGIVDTQDTTDLWSQSDGTWADWDVEWGNLGFSPQRAFPAIATTIMSKGDVTNQFGGSNFTSSMCRQDLQIGEQDEFVRIKAVYPRITGATVSIDIGSQMAPGGEIRWQGFRNFTPGVDQKINVRTTGTHLAYKIQSSSDDYWEMSGMDIEYEPVSRR